MRTCTRRYLRFRIWANKYDAPLAFGCLTIVGSASGVFLYSGSGAKLWLVPGFFCMIFGAALTIFTAVGIYKKWDKLPVVRPA